jgi:hypothetical protein
MLIDKLKLANSNAPLYCIYECIWGKLIFLYRSLFQLTRTELFLIQVQIIGLNHWGISMQALSRYKFIVVFV